MNSPNDTLENVRSNGGVQSIERCFAILTAIAKNPDGINLADLSRYLNLHTSTTFHLVRTLVDLKVVRQDKATKRYQLGRTIFALAANSLSELEMVDAARPYLEDLSRVTGEMSLLALPSGYSAVIALRLAGTGSVQLVDRTAGMRPLHCTSLGKIFLAGMNDPQLEEFLANGELKSWTHNTITDPDLIRSEIEKVRSLGLAYDDAEFDREIRCVAAPVHNFTRQVVAAIGVSGPIWRMSLAKLEEVSQLVKKTAADVSAELGHLKP